MKLPLTPIRCLYRGVDLYGKKLGVVSAVSRYTYGELRPGDRVAFLSYNNNQLLEGYYGAPLLRAIAMPLNVRLTAAELVQILNHAEPAVLVFETEFAPQAEMFRKNCASVRRYVAINGAIDAADFTYEELLARGRLERPDLLSFNEDEIAELFYTSGSTGSPKGVALSHRTLYLHALAVTGSITQNDRFVELHTIPLFHANGWGRPQTATMNGAKQVMVRRFEPGYVLKLIQDERATGMSLVPVMANALVNYPQIDQFDTSSMEEIHLGGAAASPELAGRLETIFHCRVMAGYGLTETSPVVTSSRPKATVEDRDERDRLQRVAMAGWPILGNEVRVVDSNMQEVARDMTAIGEVVIRGDNVMDGYFREPEATAAVMSEGWLHTGDMAVWDEENYIQIVDRKKDIIITGGENVSSIEVEKAICAHAAVLECAVVAAPDPKWGEVVAAIIALKPGQQVSHAELAAFLEPRLAKFKLPCIVEFREGPLPKTGTGKILKRELREVFWQGKERRVQGG
jgi:fatty-acyl-CoA synthase